MPLVSDCYNFGLITLKSILLGRKALMFIHIPLAMTACSEIEVNPTINSLLSILAPRDFAISGKFSPLPANWKHRFAWRRPNERIGLLYLCWKATKFYTCFLIRSKTTDECGGDWIRVHTTTYDCRRVYAIMQAMTTQECLEVRRQEHMDTYKSK